jgi:hypothetical protein
MIEVNGDGKATNRPGLYRLKGGDVEVVLDGHPDLGTPMIDAFVQAGYERVGDKPTEVKSTEVAPEVKVNKVKE